MDFNNLILLPGGLITKYRPEALRAVEGSSGYYSGPYLNHFTQPDTIVPDPGNSQDWDRYSYARNNPVKYTDPSGHCVWDLCILEGVGLVEVTAVIIGAVSTATFYANTPPPAALANGLDWANRQIAKTVATISAIAANTTSTSEANALLMKGEYIPDILSGDAERAAYREAVERYKKGLGIPADVNVPKDILDGIAEDIKDGMKPVDAADNAPEPPDKGLIKKGKPKVEPK